MNNVKLGSAALTNGAATNLATVTNATLRALTLNITPGGNFTNASAGNFTYNIVQPSVLPTLTTGSIPTQSAVITESTDIDLRNYFTNGKFFEITNNSATASKISATIVSGYILRLTGQGSCNDISGTTSAGSIVVAAFNEKATVDGSVSGSTASTSVVEKGSAFVSATVPLQVTACAQNATLTMAFVSAGSTLASCTVDGGTSNTSETETYAVGAIGTSFTNKMQFTIAKTNTNLATNMINVDQNTGFSIVLTDNGNTITVGFSGTYPNQSVNGNINYTFTLNIDTAANYISGVLLSMSNAGYSASSSVVIASGAAGATTQTLSTSVITAANSGTFTADPQIYYSNETPSVSQYIQVTSHTSGSPFTLTATRNSGATPPNTTITIGGSANILSSDTGGTANVVLVPNTEVTNAVTGITVHGVNVQSGGTGKHYTVNRNTANTSIPFTVVGTGSISVAISNASVSGSSVTLNSPSSSTTGTFSGTCSIGTGAQSGSFTLTATPTGRTAYSITISVLRITDSGTSGLIGYYYSGPHSVGDTQSDNYPAICDIAVGSSNSIFSKGAYNIGDVYYTTPEAAESNGAQQGSVFAGNDGYYRVKKIYFSGTAYVPLASQTFYVQIGNDGAIDHPGQITCGNDHP